MATDHQRNEARMLGALLWERVPGVRPISGSVRGELAVHRAEVPGGWIVRGYDGMTFVPDPDHSWTVGEGA